MTAVLIVRAIVDPNRRDDFDTWYQNEHLPDAYKAFSPLTANAVGAKTILTRT